MKIETFLKLLNAAKRYPGYTGSSDVRAIRNSEKTTWKIINEEGAGVKVTFKQAREGLTLFEADLLCHIVHLEKRPADYADYHKCIAGKRFIESIDRLFHLKPVIHIEIEEIALHEL